MLLSVNSFRKEIFSGYPKGLTKDTEFFNANYTDTS